MKSAPTGNADGGNPTGKRGWPWVMVTAMVTMFIQGLSRSTDAAIELLGDFFPDTEGHLDCPEDK
jgi:hypothetical protein